MRKPHIVIASENENLVTASEISLISVLGSSADYSAYTGAEYFSEFCRNERTADVLAVDERWYRPSLLSHNIGRLITITPDTGVQSLVQNIRESLPERDGRGTRTETIFVYSPVGGSGKTSIALALAGKLTGFGKKVLYIDAEYLQGFQFRLGDERTMEISEGLRTENARADFWNDIQPWIGTGRFDYLLPIPAGTKGKYADAGIFLRLISCAVMSGVYDFIVIDTDSVWNSAKEAFAAGADNVIFITSESGEALCRFRRMVRTVKDPERKILYVKNCCRPGTERQDGPDRKTPGEGASDSAAEPCDGFLFDAVIRFAGNGNPGSLKEMEALAARFV